MNLFLSLLIALTATTAIQPRPAAKQPSKPDTSKDQAAHYTLGPQDQLRITVSDEADLTNVYRIESRSATVVWTTEPGGLTRFRF